MSSILTTQGVVFATAMAVSGTFVLLAFRLQKSPSTPHFVDVSSIPQSPKSCIIAARGACAQGKKKEKKKKRVHFAEDVVNPIGNSEEYRKLHQNNCHNVKEASLRSNSSTIKNKGKVREMPANRLALYNGILRDRVIHRVAYYC